MMDGHKWTSLETACIWDILKKSQPNVFQIYGKLPG